MIKENCRCSHQDKNLTIQPSPMLSQHSLDFIFSLTGHKGTHFPQPDQIKKQKKELHKQLFLKWAVSIKPYPSRETYPDSQK